MKHETQNIQEVHTLAAQLVETLIDARVVLLQGELGAGKTTFTQGVAKALGINKLVRSPTYTLVNVYSVAHPRIDQLVHVDLYRLALVNEQELKQIGLDELVRNARSLVMIEWPERLEKPVPGLTLHFALKGDVYTVEYK
ncbi:TPA: tRNA (adenosine(37)-N6)-threonylcarbamoyltransferase complex ATPase subunit type 1 TsaE [Candidatus Uhrbacteria bacterium]|nr:tRNA (adenosine(37)-N6)-threonylcarbamoyltransferase complex ATPase subunit type 1 TsaE [Candidatus Uhrbacteria bacterium]